MPSSHALRLRGLYAITPQMADTARLCLRVRECISGGAALVQYRQKGLDHAHALQQARELAALCREAGVPLIVNDSIELALASSADGVHVGRDDAAVAEARRALPRGIVGASCYADPKAAAAAARDGADYVGIGSVFASATKPAAARAPLSALAQARREGGIAVAAIGGITPDNAREAIEAGADMVAVVSALFDAPDVARAAQSIARLFDTGPSTHARSQPRAL